MRQIGRLRVSISAVELIKMPRRLPRDTRRLLERAHTQGRGRLNNLEDERFRKP